MQFWGNRCLQHAARWRELTFQRQKIAEDILGKRGKKLRSWALLPLQDWEKNLILCHPPEIPPAPDVKIIHVEQDALRALVLSSPGLVLGLPSTLCLYVNIHNEWGLPSVAPFRTPWPPTDHCHLAFPSSSPFPWVDVIHLWHSQRPCLTLESAEYTATCAHSSASKSCLWFTCSLVICFVTHVS